MSEYRVNLEIFAGPMDLLLYLVRKEEVDIYDIPISRITEEYIKYIELMKSLDMDLAGDFLIMAATLMEIKSAMLLPKTIEGDTSEQSEPQDLKGDLIRQLLEYKKFKDAANLLDASASQRSFRFTRPDVIIEKLKPDTEPEIEIEQISVWDLLEAFDKILKATGNYQDYSKIKDDTPIDLYQIDILDQLQRQGGMTFETIFQGSRSKIAMVGKFLAILELIRQKLIWAEQDGADSQIYLKPLTNEQADIAVRNAMIADVNSQEPTNENKPAIPIVELPAKEQNPLPNSNVQQEI